MTKVKFVCPVVRDYTATERVKLLGTRDQLPEPWKPVVDEWFGLYRAAIACKDANDSMKN